MKRRVKSGRHKGNVFDLEANIKDMPNGTDCLATLASRGNLAAMNAIKKDGYKVHDRPFFYGKIGYLGYIIAEKDLGEVIP